MSSTPAKDKNISRENKMGTMHMPRLVLTMALPIVISMLVQALYNVVDSIFVAMISEDALTAVSLAFPIQNLMISVGSGTAVGSCALLSRALGEKRQDLVNKIACHIVILAIFSGLLFLIIGLFFVKPFFMSQTDIQSILDYGIDYLTICSSLSVGLMFQMMFERTLQATGRSIYSMYSQLTGAIINLILDPIMIFGLLGFPALGVRGAAIATVTGQIIAGIFALILNIKINKDITLNMKGFSIDFKLILEIYKIGFPSIIMMAISSIMSFGLNQILLGFGSTAAAVFGAYFKLQSFVFMPIFGINNGTVPIVAYNYGAGSRERVLSAWKVALIYSVSIMAIGMIVFWVIPEQLLALFSASDAMIAMGVPALRIISLNFVVAAFCIITGSLFQALGKAMYTMITSVLRQLILLLPAAYLLSLTGNVNNVWWCFPISEVGSLIINIVFFIDINKKIISHIGEKGHTMQGVQIKVY